MWSHFAIGAATAYAMLIMVALLSAIRQRVSRKQLSAMALWSMEISFLVLMNALVDLTVALAQGQRAYSSILTSCIMWKGVPILSGMPLDKACFFIVTSLIADISAWVANFLVRGGEFRVSPIGIFTMVSIAWLVAAVMQAKVLQDCFRYEQKLIAEHSALEVTINMVGDAIFWLGRDCRTVLRCDDRLSSLVGVDMVDKDIEPYILDTAHGNELFGDALQRAIDVAPQKTLFTLLNTSGDHIVVDACIVGLWDCQTQGHGNGFLVTLRMANNCSESIGSQAPRVSPEEDPKPGSLSATDKGPFENQDNQSQLSSVGSTTPSGQAFARMEKNTKIENEEEKALALKDRLTEISETGRTEHWLVKASEVQLNPYHILGVGTFGITVRGTFRYAPVAVKLARYPDESRRSKHLMSVSNELRILRQIRHTNIVSFYGAVVDTTNLDVAIIMEWIRGVPLHKFIRNGLFTCDRMRLLLETLAGLSFLHHHRPRIIHGDLKAPNVMVETGATYGIRAKLLDFGLSNIETRTPATLGGTLAWMAPEVILNLHMRPVTSADIFSYGRLIYFVMTGKMPLVGLPRDKIVKLAVKWKYPDLDWGEGELIPESKVIGEKCMKLEAKDRPTCDDIYEVIRQWKPSELTSKITHEAPWIFDCNEPELRPGSGSRWEADVQQARENVNMNKKQNIEKQAQNRQPRERGNDVAADQEAPKNDPITSSSTPKAPRGDALRFPSYRPTTTRAKATMIADMIIRWNFMRDRDKCCVWHAALVELEMVMEKLRNGPCNQGFPLTRKNSAPWIQCERCRALADPSEYVEPGAPRMSPWYCEVCSFENEGAPMNGMVPDALAAIYLCETGGIDGPVVLPQAPVPKVQAAIPDQAQAAEAANTAAAAGAGAISSTLRKLSL